MEKELEKNGIPVGSEKDEVVNIIACPGTERCKFANIDTIGLAKKIDQKRWLARDTRQNENFLIRLPVRMHESYAQRDRDRGKGSPGQNRRIMYRLRNLR